MEKTAEEERKVAGEKKHLERDTSTHSPNRVRGAEKAKKTRRSGEN